MKIIEQSSTSIGVEATGGPVVFGQFMNSSEHRFISALLCAIGSHLDDCVMLGLTSPSPYSVPCPWPVRGGGEIRELDFELLVMQPFAVGRIVDPQTSREMVIANSRGEIEECVYQTFARADFYLVRRSVLKEERSFHEMCLAVESDFIMRISGDYSVVDIDWKDEQFSPLIAKQTDRVLLDFNQVCDGPNGIRSTA